MLLIWQRCLVFLIIFVCRYRLDPISILNQQAWGNFICFHQQESQCDSILVDIIWFIGNSYRDAKKIPKEQMDRWNCINDTALYNYVLWTQSASTQQHRQISVFLKRSTNKWAPKKQNDADMRKDLCAECEHAYAERHSRQFHSWLLLLRHVPSFHVWWMSLVLVYPMCCIVASNSWACDIRPINGW